MSSDFKASALDEPSFFMMLTGSFLLKHRNPGNAQFVICML